MDEFLFQLQIVLPVLGVNAIRVRPTRSAVAAEPGATESPVFALKDKRSGTDARAQQLDGEFTVLADSIGVADWVINADNSASTLKSYASYQAEHRQLVANGVIDVSSGRDWFTRNYVFTSPSRAAAIILGRSCNGRKEWVSADGRTFEVWEARDVG
jgi:hypothetical protein